MFYSKAKYIRLYPINYNPDPDSLNPYPDNLNPISSQSQTISSQARSAEPHPDLLNQTQIC